jgi:hypothetical protein
MLLQNDLQSLNDSFAVRFSSIKNFKFDFRVSENDTTDMGTDGAPGAFAFIYLNNDSIRMDYDNLPFDQVTWFHIKSPKGKTVYRFHFNRISAYFTPQYANDNNSKSFIEVPEVFELANIIGRFHLQGNEQQTYINKVIITKR